MLSRCLRCLNVHDLPVDLILHAVRDFRKTTNGMQDLPVDLILHAVRDFRKTTNGVQDLPVDLILHAVRDFRKTTNGLLVVCTVMGTTTGRFSAHSQTSSVSGIRNFIRLPVVVVMTCVVGWA